MQTHICPSVHNLHEKSVLTGNLRLKAPLEVVRISELCAPTQTTLLLFLVGLTQCQRARAQMLLSGWKKASDSTSYSPQCEKVGTQTYSNSSFKCTQCSRINLDIVSVFSRMVSSQFYRQGALQAGVSILRMGNRCRWQR